MNSKVAVCYHASMSADKEIEWMTNSSESQALSIGGWMSVMMD